MQRPTSEEQVPEDCRATDIYSILCHVVVGNPMSSVVQPSVLQCYFVGSPMSCGPIIFWFAQTFQEARAAGHERSCRSTRRRMPFSFQQACWFEVSKNKFVFIYMSHESILSSWVWGLLKQWQANGGNSAEAHHRAYVIGLTDEQKHNNRPFSSISKPFILRLFAPLNSLSHMCFRASRTYLPGTRRYTGKAMEELLHQQPRQKHRTDAGFIIVSECIFQHGQNT